MKTITFQFFLLVLLTCKTVASYGQQSTINPQNIFDLGTTIGTIHAQSASDFQNDAITDQLTRATNKFHKISHTEWSDPLFTVSDSNSYSVARILRLLKQETDQMSCLNPYSGIAGEIFESGYELAMSYHQASTSCSGCLEEHLINMQLLTGVMVNHFLDSDNSDKAQVCQEISDLAGMLSSEIQHDHSDEYLLEQNDQIQMQIVQCIAKLNLVFEQKYIDCENEVFDAEEEHLCEADKLTTLSVDSTGHTFVVAGNSTTYLWRYRYNAGDWIFAETYDTVLYVEKSSSDDVEAQVMAWCSELTDVSSIISETIVYHYSYGCYPPGYHDLGVTHISTNSARLHVRTTSSKVKWAYRPAGGNWKYYTTSSRSINYTGLTAGRKYEFACQVWCGYSWSKWSNVKYFYTKNSYCYSKQPTVSHVTTYGARTTSSQKGKKQWRIRARGGSWKYYTNSYTWMTWKCKPATTYEVCYRIWCHGGWSKWSSPCTWTTKGTYCHTPSYGHLSIYNITQTTATAKVNLSASSYYWSIRPLGGQWYNFKTNGNSISWKSMTPGTTYEYKVKIYCNGYWTGYSPLKRFTTKYSSCHIPGSHDFWHSNVSHHDVYINVNTSASKIEYAFSNDGGKSWQKFVSTYKRFRYYNLKSNWLYHYSVRFYCNGSWTDWASTKSFRTKHSGRSTNHSSRERGAGEQLQIEEATDSSLPDHQVSSPTTEVVRFNPDVSDSQRDSRIEHLQVYPNPTSDFFRINLESEADIRIISVQGQIVKEIKDYVPDNNIDILELAPGIYNVQISLGMETHHEKLMVQR